MSALIDFSKLPAPDVVEPLDFETILNARKASLLLLVPEDMRATVAATLELESEMLTKLFEENSYRETGWRQRVNEAAKAVMLPYAKGNDLENLVAFFEVERLTIVPANPDANPPVDAVYEDDDALLERGQNAYEGLSIAGPTKAYEFHSRSADGRVADASCVSPEPCDILITALGAADDGTVPEEALAAVRKKLSEEDLRPVGDRVTVQAARVVLYEIDADLIVADSSPEKSLLLPAAMTNAKAYAKARRRLGQSIYRAKIDAALGVEGVDNVEIVSPPANIARNKEEAAICTRITLRLKQEDGTLLGSTVAELVAAQ
ncbi:baseplate assembly protein [Pandoraea captiosa]|uniref:Baseplate assembly protein n=1 Tax=Pandoraea captiosa TaxID=2508302 RepID=A0A5E5A513_9BURK|nr:baseplate J/gp47 family protein [Pandoraea captiosa]VVE67882.1 baseplate assembly protein [Pandoraea captiosa]